MDLKKCIRRLPVELREVLELYYSGGGLTYKAIAELLGVSQSQVNKWLTTARKELRACMEREDSSTSCPD